MAVGKLMAICPQCKGEGFYFRLPSGMNPFKASIEVTAANMRRITCYCPAGRAALASPVKED